MSTPTAAPTHAPASTFVPASIDGAKWGALEPYYSQLIGRTLHDAASLERLLLDRSELDAAADEALPDEAPSAVEVARAIAAGKYPGQKKDKTRSKAIIDGLGTCYYTFIDSLRAPPASAHCEHRVEGTNIAFSFVESPAGHVTAEKKAAHEIFIYVLDGELDARVGAKKKRVKKGDVIHVPRGKGYTFTVTKRGPVRYAGVQSTPRLEAHIRKYGAADNWRG